MSIKIGLTGSIGMGKSTVANMCRVRDIPVFDADACVRALQAKNGPAIAPIVAEFPDCIKDGELDRAALRYHMVHDQDARKKLEAIMHPMVQVARDAFVHKAEISGHYYMIFDVPLLFETGGQNYCDYTISVFAPLEIQRARVLERTGMTLAIFEAILASQMPAEQKCKMADYCLRTDCSLDETEQQLSIILQDIETKTVGDK